MTGNPEIQKLLMQAMQAQQKGDMDGAEAACRSALALDPDQAAISAQHTLLDLYAGE